MKHQEQMRRLANQADRALRDAMERQKWEISVVERNCQRQITALRHEYDTHIVKITAQRDEARALNVSLQAQLREMVEKVRRSAAATETEAMLTARVQQVEKQLEQERRTQQEQLQRERDTAAAQLREMEERHATHLQNLFESHQRELQTRSSEADFTAKETMYQQRIQELEELLDARAITPGSAEVEELRQQLAQEMATSQHLREELQETQRAAQEAGHLFNAFLEKAYRARDEATAAAAARMSELRELRSRSGHTSSPTRSDHSNSLHSSGYHVEGSPASLFNNSATEERAPPNTLEDSPTSLKDLARALELLRLLDKGRQSNPSSPS